MRNSAVNSSEPSEIDFGSVLRMLWEKKWIAIGVAAVTTALAAVYAFTTTPVYEARGYVVPPTQNDIANFNYGRGKETGLTPYSVKDVYGFFVTNMQTESLRRKLFDEVYVPSLSKAERDGPQDLLYSQFSKKIVVVPPSKDAPDRYLVSAQNSDPQIAMNWVDSYIKRAGESAEIEIAKNVSREAKGQALNLAIEIDILRETGKQEREDVITKLREARKIASAIGLEKPPVIQLTPSVEVAGSMDRSLIYLRGTKAIDAEIETLTSRVSDDPFISHLREIQAKYNVFKTMEARPQDVAVYRLDGMIQLPDTPVKPRKLLILLLGGLGGLVLGCMVAVGYQVLTKRGTKY